VWLTGGGDVTKGDDTGSEGDPLIPGGMDGGREGGRDGNVSTRGNDATQFTSESLFANLQ